MRTIFHELKNISYLCACTALLASSLMAGGCGGEPERHTALPEASYITLKEEELVLSSELPGRVSAFFISDVRPQVNGIISERLFEEGSDVEEGQVLYRIVPEVYEAAYNNAQAALKRAEANATSARLLARRYEKLVKTDAVSKQDYDDAVAANKQALAEVQSCKEALESARINLSYTQVVSPISGRIGHSFVTQGALVTQNQPSPLATVQQLNPVYVDVHQSSTQLLNLRRALAAGNIKASSGNSARIRLRLEDGSAYTRNLIGPGAKATNEDWIEGDLKFADVTIDQSTGMVTVRAEFENPELVLLPGMYVRAVLDEGIKADAILIPQKAMLRTTRGEPYVYVLTKDTVQGAPEGVSLAEGQYFVERRSISIGRDDNNRWLVNEGLKPGEMLVVEGLQRIRQGAIVKAKPAADAAAPAGQGR